MCAAAADSVGVVFTGIAKIVDFVGSQKDSFDRLGMGQRWGSSRRQVQRGAIPKPAPSAAQSDDCKGGRMRYDLAAASRPNHRRFGMFGLKQSIGDGVGRLGFCLCGLLSVFLCSSFGPLSAVSVAHAEESRKIATVIGSCGSKAKPLVGADLSSVLRSALVKELRSMPLIRVYEESRNASVLSSGYNIDGSVTQLAKRVNPQGDLEVSADVSLIISVLPGRRVIGMVSGGATVIGSSTVDTHFMTLLVQNLQQEAITQAAHEAAASWVESLSRQQGRKNPKLVAMR